MKIGTTGRKRIYMLVNETSHALGMNGDCLATSNHGCIQLGLSTNLWHVTKYADSGGSKDEMAGHRTRAMAAMRCGAIQPVKQCPGRPAYHQLQ